MTKPFSFRGLRPLTPWPGVLLLPLDPAGGSAPDPHARYRIALRARHSCPPHIFTPGDAPVDGDAAPPRKWTQQFPPPLFSGCLLWPNGRPSRQLLLLSIGYNDPRCGTDSSSMCEGLYDDSEWCSKQRSHWLNLILSLSSNWVLRLHSGADEERIGAGVRADVRELYQILLLPDEPGSAGSPSGPPSPPGLEENLWRLFDRFLVDQMSFVSPSFHCQSIEGNTKH